MKIAYNITTIFALPLLGWQRKMLEPYLVNAYIKHEGVEHFQEDHIFILLKESTDKKYKKVEDTLIENKHHVSQYYVDNDNEYVMHVFKCPDIMLPDYKLFYEGKYSRMSNKAKDLVLASSKVGGITTKVLSRSKELAKIQEKKIGQELSAEEEVWSSIHDKNNIIKEIFTDAVFKQIEAAN